MCTYNTQTQSRKCNLFSKYDEGGNNLLCKAKKLWFFFLLCFIFKSNQRSILIPRYRSDSVYDEGQLSSHHRHHIASSWFSLFDENSIKAYHLKCNVLRRNLFHWCGFWISVHFATHFLWSVFFLLNEYFISNDI